MVIGPGRVRHSVRAALEYPGALVAIAGGRRTAHLAFGLPCYDPANNAAFKTFAKFCAAIEVCF